MNQQYSYPPPGGAVIIGSVPTQFALFEVVARGPEIDQVVQRLSVLFAFGTRRKSAFPCSLFGGIAVVFIKRLAHNNSVLVIVLNVRIHESRYLLHRTGRRRPAYYGARSFSDGPSLSL